MYIITKHTAYTSTDIFTKHTVPTSTEIFNKHVPHINRHPVQVHSNFQFTPKLASSHREWSFSAAILINQGSGSREKLQDAKHYNHHRHTLNSFTRLPARIPVLNHYQEMF